MSTETEINTLSNLLRTRTAMDHSNAESGGFTTALVQGEVPFEGYVDMLAQHQYAYEVLERVSKTFASDPDIGAFIDEKLYRLEALDADLVDLAGPDWKSVYPASPATVRYCARLEATTANPVAHLAHHYTRYLGDLSGGKMIGRVAARVYEFKDGYGGRFAQFTQIDDANAYRNHYRELLDGLNWSHEQQEEMIAEVQEAYNCNTDVFGELARYLAK